MEQEKAGGHLILFYFRENVNFLHFNALLTLTFYLNYNKNAFICNLIETV